VHLAVSALITASLRQERAFSRNVESGFDSRCPLSFISRGDCPTTKIIEIFSGRKIRTNSDTQADVNLREIGYFGWVLRHGPDWRLSLEHFVFSLKGWRAAKKIVIPRNF
jgi:hypothetical protein